MSLLVLTDQDAEPDASSPVTFIAQLMKANYFCFNSTFALAVVAPLRLRLRPRLQVLLRLKVISKS
jgi:hypothetical protein